MFALAFSLLAAAGAFYSQYGQDKFVHKTFFPDKKEGVFVEIGASDGISKSNTYFFEQSLGWKGLCVEPIPETFTKLEKNRKAICIQGCIKELQENRGKKESIEVPNFSLNGLLQKNHLSRVDYLSIDTGGGELQILQSIDFDAFAIDVIGVENKTKDKSIGRFLESKGYVFIKNLGGDEIYKKPSLLPYTGKDRPGLSFIQQFLPKNPVIVEAGAHDGNDTSKLSKLWEHGTIYAFEPSPKVYRMLKKRCGKKNNVKTFSVALGDKIGYARFYESQGKGSNTDAQGSLLPPSSDLWAWDHISFKKPIEVPVTTLDAWADANEVKRIDFLWLDMQGSELQMLKASPKILKTVRVIQTEVSRKAFYEGTGVLDEMQKWLEKEGFVPVYITQDDHGDALFVRNMNYSSPSKPLKTR